MTPPDIILWAFALLMFAAATSCIIVIGYVTFKVLREIEEKGLHY